MGISTNLFLATLSAMCSLLWYRSFRSFLIFAVVLNAFIASLFHKARTAVANPPRSTPVPSTKTRICVAGYPACPSSAHSHNVAAKIAEKYPQFYETWYYFDFWGYFPFLKEKFDPVPFPLHLKGHATAPFVWLERGTDDGQCTESQTPVTAIQPIGGNDRFCEWVLEHFGTDTDITEMASAKPSKAIWKWYHANGPKQTAKDALAHQKVVSPTKKKKDKKES